MGTGFRWRQLVDAFRLGWVWMELAFNEQVTQKGKGFLSQSQLVHTDQYMPAFQRSRQFIKIANGLGMCFAAAAQVINENACFVLHASFQQQLVHATLEVW